MRNKPQREPVKIGDFVGFCYCDGTETVGTVIAMTQKRSRQKKGKIIPCVMIAQLPEGDVNACSLVELALHGLFPLPSPEQMVEIYQNFRRQRLAQLPPVGWQQMLGSEVGNA